MCSLQRIGSDAIVLGRWARSVKVSARFRIGRASTKKGGEPSGFEPRVKRSVRISIKLATARLAYVPFTLFFTLLLVGRSFDLPEARIYKGCRTRTVRMVTIILKSSNSPDPNDSESCQSDE